MARAAKKAERALGQLVRAVPTAHPEETAEAVRRRLHGNHQPHAEVLCVVDGQERLIGMLDMGGLVRAKGDATIESLMGALPPSASLDTNQEHGASLALRHGLTCLPVTNLDHSFAGVVPAGALLEILRREHVEDLHRLAGIRRENTSARQALEQPPARRVRHRLPWLLIGLLGSMGAAWILSRFEHLLAEHISIAFFVPTIVYLADAIGTQTEAIAVRGLSVSRSGLGRLLGGELRTGVMLGAILGGAGCAAVWLLTREGGLAISVGLAILVAGAMAAGIGLFLPWILHRFGVDPAFGSGPLATVIQDVLSVAIYLGIATSLTS